jgi:PAS domain S-box-containing protein
MAQDTAAHFSTPAPVTGTDSRNYFRFGEWKIGALLTASFAAIVLLMIVGDAIAVLQLDRVETRAGRFYQEDQKSLAIMHVYLDVLTFRDTLTGSAYDQNPYEFASRATALRDNFLRDVTHAQQTLSSAPDVSQDPTILIKLQTVRAALPSQVDTFLELVKVEDWQAVRFRMAGQVQPLIALSSSLVADVEQEVVQERARALESVQRTRRQLYLVLPITALLSLLMAAMLGWYVTRRISRPLAQLDAGAQALARGEFGYEVELRGNDELADLARASNYAAQQLRKLYDVIKRSEAYLAESNARLEEAQRITHVGYWEWDLETDCLIWSDETYRIFGLRPQERPMNVDALREMIHPEDRDRVFREKEQTITSGVCYDVEHRIVRPSGEVRVLNSTRAVKKDESGRPAHFYGTVQDITDRKRAEEALQQNQFYLAEGQRLAHMGSWAFNATGFTYWSSELFQVHGLDPRGKPPTVAEYLALVHPEDRAFMEHGITQMLVDHRAFDFTKRIVRPDGKIRHVRCVGIPVTQRGTFQGFLGTGMDVTELKRAEEELQQLVDFVPQLIVVFDSDGKWIYANRMAREYTGLTLEEFRSLDVIGRAIHPDDVERVRAARERGFARSEPFELDARFVRKDGVYRWFLIRYNPFKEEGRVRRWYATATEIESRKQEEDRVRKENVRLEERTRIAQELHDTLLQTFLSASMQLSVALDGISPDSLVKPRLDRILQLMNQGIEEGRSTIQGLRSSDSRTLDLVLALSSVQQELAVQPDMDFRVTVAGRQQPLRPPIRNEIYRIGREALLNAFCHSGAKSVEFELEYADSDLRMRVRDNGCGIDPQVLAAGREGHWGLTGMQERATRIGGLLKISSSAAAGTEVQLSVPGALAFQVSALNRSA